MEIRGKTISYASYKKKEDSKHEKQLNDEIAHLEKDVNDTNLESLERKKSELELIRRKTVDGLIIRSKAHNMEEGGHNSKYFSNLEKRNYIDKSVFLLEKEDKSIITDPIQIKEETETFYKELYSSSYVYSEAKVRVTLCMNMKIMRSRNAWNTQTKAQVLYCIL